jgi:hypothetical protein
VAKRAIAALGLVWCASAIIALGLFSPLNLLSVAVGILAIFLLQKKKLALESPFFLLFFLIIGLVLRLIWLLSTRVEMQVDFLRIHETAQAIAFGTEIPMPSYQAIFPHVVGYPVFLSVFYKLFSPSIPFAQGLNVLFELLCLLLVYDIARRLRARTAGGVALFLFAIAPPLIFQTSIICNEIPHMLMALLSVDLFVLAMLSKGKKALLVWGALGAVIALGNILRPYGPIFLLAIVLTTLLIQLKMFRIPVIFLETAIMLIAYFLVSQLGNLLIQSVVFGSIPMAEMGIGWNLFVGLNASSSGQWSASDYQILTQYLEQGLSAPEIQSQFLRLSLERFHSLSLGSLLRLIAQKLKIVWGGDQSVVSWLMTMARADSLIPLRNISGILRVLCNGFYGILLGGAGYCFVKKPNILLALPLLLLLGLTILFAVLEANPRYHFGATPFLILLCAAALKPVSSDNLQFDVG